MREVGEMESESVQVELGGEGMSVQAARKWLERLQRRGWGEETGLERREVYRRGWEVLVSQAPEMSKASWIALVAAHLHPSSLIWLQAAQGCVEGPLRVLAREAFRSCGARWSLGRLLLEGQSEP